MKGQINLFKPDFIRDKDCTKDTPVKYGRPDTSIYGTGERIKPRIPGRNDTEHMKKIFLPELLPLEEYDLVIVLLSGGKDSIACYYKLLELGVPKKKIECWHHDIDGGHPSRRMDWRCTQNYIKAFAEAEEVPLRLSWRVNGFFGELYRVGASEPVQWMEPYTGEIRQCKISSNHLLCQKIKEKATDDMEEQLKKYGYRMKFPAKSGTHQGYLKIKGMEGKVMNKITAEEVAKMAAKEAVNEFVLAQERAEKQRVFQNTKLLMENYNSIKAHVEDGIAETKDLEEDIDTSGVDPDQLFIYSIKRSKLRSLVMIAHIEKCLELLEREERAKNTPEKFLAYQYFYIDGMSYESIAEVYGYCERTTRRWITELNKLMGVYLFGADALKVVL